MDIRLLEKSRVSLRLNLDVGVTVPSGSVVENPNTGVRFSVLNNTTNSGVVTGDVYTPAISLDKEIAASVPGSITKILVSIPGWNSVTNDNSSILPNDIDLSTGDLVLTSGAEEVRQNIKIRLKFFQGEWFLNTLIGIPYFGTILIKNPNLSAVRSIIREAVEGIPKVRSVTSVETEITTGSRELKISLEVVTDFDENIVFEDVLIF